MPAVTLSEVSLSFGINDLLKAVNVTLARGQKTALSGANGSGKSTLLRIIVGEVKPDSGQVVREKDTRIAYLPQLGIRHSDRLLYEEVEQAFMVEAKLYSELRTLEVQLGEHREASTVVERLLNRYAYLQHRLQDSAYERRQDNIERVLQGLGFARSQFSQPVSHFSEGWQMRIALARILCERPDVLLLDEPTNYLDLEARNWLESFLCEFPGSIMLVSHDRFFLDTTMDSVLELYLGKTKLYPGRFSHYERRRAAEMEQLSRAYLQQQEEIERIERFVNRFRYQATKSKQVQSRVKLLERMDRIEPPPTLKRMHFSFPDPPHSGKLSLKLENVGKSYNSKRVFAGVNLELSRGDRLVLLGVNGAGKSTLMRILAGTDKPSEGSLSYGSGITTGFFSAEQLDSTGLEANDSSAEADTVIKTLEECAPTNVVPHLRGLLGAFLFQGDDIYKFVTVLSGGERSRLALLKLLLKPSNLLFLDEPTNHLDLSSKDILLEALSRYSGSMVFVSHDRYFIEKLATRVLEIDRGRATLYYGDYAYYLWRKEQQEEQPGETVKRPAGVSKGGQARHTEKARLGRLRRLEKEEAELLFKVEHLQAESVELEQAMAREEVYTDGEKMKEIRNKLAQLKKRQEESLSRWEELEREQRSYS